MRVAVVHYWWLSNRGGESVLTNIIELFPTADLYLHVCDEELVFNTLGGIFKGKIFKTFISRLPRSRIHYQKYLPLMPLALEQLDLTNYDLIISSESGPAKGVLTRPNSLHICYCHSPMRYIWDMYHDYLSRTGFLIRILYPFIAHWLRVWDRLSADRVDFFIANSSFVSSRINKFYRRSSDVIYPPVNTELFDHSRARSDFYLCLGQLVHYKRADLAIDAFARLGLPLVVIGEGELYDQLVARSTANIRILGRQPFSVVKDHLERCKALIFPGEEDFGIVPVEAMAAGAPVIAYDRGGIVDTVVDGKTGILFKEQTVDSLIAAVGRMESGVYNFDKDEINLHSQKFDKSIFKIKFVEFIERCIQKNSHSH